MELKQQSHMQALQRKNPLELHRDYSLSLPCRLKILANHHVSLHPQIASAGYHHLQLQAYGRQQYPAQKLKIKRSIAGPVSPAALNAPKTTMTITASPTYLIFFIPKHLRNFTIRAGSIKNCFTIISQLLTLVCGKIKDTCQTAKQFQKI